MHIGKSEKEINSYSWCQFLVPYEVSYTTFLLTEGKWAGCHNIGVFQSFLKGSSISKNENWFFKASDWDN